MKTQTNCPAMRRWPIHGVALLLTAFLASCSTSPRLDAEDAPVQSFRGAEHCDWESVEILRVSAEIAPAQVAGDLWVDFVRDREGVLSENLVSGPHDASTRLPADAREIDHPTAYGDLWLSSDDPKGAYLVNDDGSVERWPAGDPGCD